MNPFIEKQLRQMIAAADALKASCRIAAEADDGQIDSEEQKLLQKIDRATDKYAEKLRKLVGSD